MVLSAQSSGPTQAHEAPGAVPRRHSAKGIRMDRNEATGTSTSTAKGTNPSFSRDAVHLGTELQQRRGASWHRASAETRCILAQRFSRDAVHLGTELRQRCGASSAELRQRRGASWHRASAEMRCVFGRASAETRCILAQSFGRDAVRLRQSFGRDAVHLGTELRQRCGASSAELRQRCGASSAEMSRASAETLHISAKAWGPHRRLPPGDP